MGDEDSERSTWLVWWVLVAGLIAVMVLTFFAHYYFAVPVPFTEAGPQPSGTAAVILAQ